MLRSAILIQIRLVWLYWCKPSPASFVYRTCDIPRILIPFSLCTPGKEVCYKRLGCFSDSPPWAGIPGRQLAGLPSSPDAVNTNFLLFTRDNRVKYQVRRCFVFKYWQCTIHSINCRDCFFSYIFLLIRLLMSLMENLQFYIRHMIIFFHLFFPFSSFQLSEEPSIFTTR